MEKKLERMLSIIECHKPRSAWDKGVKQYALEMLDNLSGNWVDLEFAFSNENTLYKTVLNGASSLMEYSEGGCALIYNRDIAERLCTPSELKKTDYGMKDPNKMESWIQCQTRALIQAWQIVRLAFAEVNKAC